MKTRLFACALAAAIAVPAPLAALTNQYVSYTFSGYADQEDPYFPTFTLYAADFLTDPDPSAFGARRLFSATDLVASNNVASVAFDWCCGMSQRPTTVTIYQRFAYPGTSQFGGRVDTLTVGERGNGAFLFNVTLVDGSVPAFTPQIAPLSPFPGAWETPIGSTVQIDPTAVPPSVVPEPSTWSLLIAGFGLVGLRMRRRVRAAA